MAVQPVCVSVQDPLLGAPGVPRDRAHRELALDDGPEGDHRQCGARQCQHLARGTVPRAARLGQPGTRQRCRLAIATAILPRAARDVEGAGAVPRVQVPREPNPDQRLNSKQCSAPFELLGSCQLVYDSGVLDGLHTHAPSDAASPAAWQAALASAHGRAPLISVYGDNDWTSTSARLRTRPAPGSCTRTYCASCGHSLSSGPTASAAAVASAQIVH
eukprot:scaffold75493_cov64-Phaeocystis_antarctica.AAC.1